MAEGARLESVYTFTRIEGSNPLSPPRFCFKNTETYLKGLIHNGLSLFIFFKSLAILVLLKHDGDKWGMIGYTINRPQILKNS